jgi:hypothetical protein
MKDRAQEPEIPRLPSWIKPVTYIFVALLAGLVLSLLTVAMTKGRLAGPRAEGPATGRR